jgi:hypothetical protein
MSFLEQRPPFPPREPEKKIGRPAQYGPLAQQSSSCETLTIQSLGHSSQPLALFLSSSAPSPAAAASARCPLGRSPLAPAAGHPSPDTDTGAPPPLAAATSGAGDAPTATPSQLGRPSTRRRCTDSSLRSSGAQHRASSSGPHPPPHPAVLASRLRLSVRRLASCLDLPSPRGPIGDRGSAGNGAGGQFCPV